MTSAKKFSAKKFSAIKFFWPLGLPSMLLASMLMTSVAMNAQGAVTDLATAPMVNGSSFQVKPNIFLMMDDSGSMAWDYMPDNKNTVFFPVGTYGYVSNQCNGVFYNPQVTYIPPVQSSGVSYGNSSFIAAPVDGYGITTTSKTNLSASFVVPTFTGGGGGGGGGVPAYYYTYSGTNNSNAQKTYFISTSSFFKECDTSLNAGNTSNVTVALQPTDAAQVSQINALNSSGMQSIMAAPTDVEDNSYLLAVDIANQINACTAAATGSCTVSGFSATVNAIVTPSTNSAGSLVISAPDGSSTGTPLISVAYSGAVSSTVAVNVAKTSSGTVSGITVNGVQLMGQSTGTQASTSNLTAVIVDNINDCEDPASMAAALVAGSFSITNCPAGGSGYSAVETYSSGTTVNGFIIYSPATTTATPLVSLTKTGTVTVTPTAFTTGALSGSSTISATAFTAPAGLGLFHKVTVSATSGPGSTDERTNFANWYSYYRTRILMMKSATGIAFSNLSNNYRVGFGTMNNNGGNMFVNVSDFNSTQKIAFLNKLYAATPGNSTPLLMALSSAGLMYADAITKLNGVTVVDPMQYSCQQNYTLLTTDGFWNVQNNQILTGGASTTAVGDQDSSEPPTSKQNDGGFVGFKQQTGPLQFTTDFKQTTAPLQWATNLEKTAAPLQWTTNLQKTTSTLQWSTNLQAATGTLKWATNLQATTGTLKWATNLQATPGTLQWATNLQAATGTLQWATKQQATPGTLQWATKQQATPGTLQWATNLQSTPGTLKWATNLEKTTAQLQWATKQQMTTYTLQKSTNSGTTWSNVGASGSCISNGTNKLCRANAAGGGPGTAYTTYASPSCAITYSLASNPSTGNSGTVTADASGNIVTACPVNAAYSASVSVGAGNTCNGSLANVQCSTTGASTAYVATYPPTCTTNFNAGGSSTADGSGNVVTACPTAGYNAPTTVANNGTCNGGLANVQCSVTLGAPAYVATYPPTCAATWNGAGGSSTASGTNVTSCSVNAAYSAPTTVANNGTCNGGLANVQCSVTLGAAAYVATYPPTCATTWNGAGGSSTASGTSVTACSVNAAYSAATTVANNGTCNGGLANVKCSVTLGAAAYVATYPPTCATTWNGAGGSSTASGTSVVAACPINAAYSTPTIVANNGTCNGGLANVQCSDTLGATAYVATYPPTCAATWNGAAGSSTASGTSVTTCSVNAAYSAATTVANNGTCNGGLANVQCSAALGAAAYVATYPPTCATTWNGAAGSSTASGTSVTSCTNTGAIYSTPTTVAGNGTCNGGLPGVKCSTTAPATTYLTNYPPSCTGLVTFNAGGSSTASGTSVITACAAAGVYNATKTAVGNGGTCNGTFPNVQCSVGAGTNSYVTTYPPTCAINFNAGTANTADGNGNVITACPTAGTYGSATAVGNNGACNGTTANVKCSIGATTTNYVTTSPPGCTINFNAGGANTANSSGNVISACPAPNGTFNSTWTNVPSGGSCTPGTDVNCQYNWNAGINVNTCTASVSSGAGPWTIISGTLCTPATIGGTYNTLADVAEYYYITDLRTPALGNCASGSGTGQTLCSTASPDPYNNVPTSGADAATWQHMTTFTMGLGERGYMTFSPTYQSDTSGDYYAINNLAANPPTVCSWQAAGSGTCTWPDPDPSGGPANIDDLWHAAVNGRGTYYSATDPTTLSSGLTNALANVIARTGTAAAATTSNPNITSGDNFLFSSTFVTLQWTGEVVRQELDLTTGQPITAINPVTGQSVPVIDWSAQAQLDAEPYTSRTIYTFDSTNANGNDLRLFTWGNLTATEQGYFSSPAISPLSQLCTTGATCLPVWTAGTPYTVGSQYRVGTTWYNVNTAYTALASFGAIDLANTSVVTGASGSNLVNFLDGDRSNEEGVTNDPTKYFRHRTDVLGDIVDAEAAYILESKFTYADPGYSAFAAGNLTRQGMVYVGANDGMLHAFYSDSDNMDPATGDSISTGSVTTSGGAEAWAYIPSMLMPQLFVLADKNYANNHQYFVDGSPTQGDICVSNCTNAATAVWKTILVGGLNGGGRGYYALDVTNPAQPVALWEFSVTNDSNMGYTYGNPVITKLANGTWVVLVTSGYNNVNPGDGQGHLYVLNAYTGTLDTAVNTTGIISTGVGSPTTPSGLARISAEVLDPATDNATLQVYGGDLLGNLWRFDVNNSLGGGYVAQLLATLKGPSGTAQPITAKPEVGIVGSSTVVFVGTGRYLGTSDLSAADQVAPDLQTIYGIYDPLTVGTTASVPIYANPRSNTCTTANCFVQQTLTLTTCPAGAPTSLCTVGQNVFTTSNNPVNIPTEAGWYVDLPLSGQRDYTDPALQLGTLAVTSNIPSGSSCSVGGTSYLHYFNYKTGGAVSTAAITTTNMLGVTSTVYVSGISLGNALATRPIFVELPSGAVVALIRMGSGTTTVADVPIGTGQGTTRRVSWRELLSQ